VKKTSVYLPDALKAELGAAAARTGRSEADLIRAAIERTVRSAGAEDRGAAVGATRIHRPLPTGPCLVGVGVGPSDPDLVTDRARQVLRAADRVFAASTSADAIGRAEAVVRAAEPDVVVERIELTITPGVRARRASLAAAAERLAACLDGGELVAFVTLGDPNVYSTFPALAAAVRRRQPEAVVETVPGIMAFQELAARTGTVVADEHEHVTLVALGDDLAPLRVPLDRPGDTVVVYKGGRHLPELAGELAERGRLAGAVVGELLGLPGERSVPVAEVTDRPASYLATIIVPADRRHR
jgi:precorrin-2/cobalt-factor-2 C20-methyltransferase